MNIIDTGLSVYRYFYKKVLYPDQIDNPPQILEPLTTLIKLALLNFQKDGVKIAISLNRIFIQKPALTQGAMRWIQGHCRNDIHHLLRPIYRFIDYYPPNGNIAELYRLAINGLRNLKRTYEKEQDSSIITHSLELYIEILDNKLNEKSIHVDSYKKLKELVNKDDNKLKEHIDTLFKNDIWKEDEVELIINMLIKAKNDGSYIHAIESIIHSKEGIIDQKIKNSLMNI